MTGRNLMGAVFDERKWLTKVLVCVKIINKTFLLGAVIMKLSRLLRKVTYRELQGTKDPEIRSLRCDSRQVEKGDVFVCIRGYETDGHRFLAEAIRKGAGAVVVQEECPGCRKQSVCRALRERLQRDDGCAVAIVEVSDTRYALAMMAAAYYGYPANELSLIGITGTKGKTTTAYMIRAGLMAAGRKPGLIGTVQIDTGRRVFTCSNTTPESLQIQEYLREMVDSGCDSVVMEVSSQALKLGRTIGLEFDAAVFTNLGRDHIGPGEHADMEEYLQCKRRLFFQCKTAIGNRDDGRLDALWKGTPCDKITYGTDGQTQEADYLASEVRCMEDRSGLGVSCRVEGRLTGRLKLTMPGRFNVSNALAAMAVLKELDVEDEVILSALKQVQVPGRMETVEGPADCRILIDYAHNAMSLQKSLTTLREYHPKRLMVIFGCGGNRSRERRFTMGEVAGTYADVTIITTDNPRFERPESIMVDIECGIRKTKGRYTMIEDRREAVAHAIRKHQAGDVILIAGKGHETYQEIQGIRYPMDDRELVRTCTQTLS